jgi:hypothetical protein
LEEAYKKVYLKEEEEKYNMDEVPSDQEMERALEKYYQEHENPDELTKKLFTLKSLKSFFEEMKQTRDSWNSAYPKDRKTTIADAINSIYSDTYKDVHGIRMTPNVTGRFALFPEYHPLISMAFSYFRLYREDELTRDERNLGYENREVLYDLELKIDRFIDDINEDADLPSIAKQIFDMIESANFKQDNDNFYKNNLLDSVRTSIKRASNLDENERKYLLANLPEKI